MNISQTAGTASQTAPEPMRVLSPDEVAKVAGGPLIQNRAN